MNIYATIILAALLLDYVLEIAAHMLNIRALRLELPEEFNRVYEPEAYRRSQEYTRESTRFKLFRETFGLVVLLLFWWLGGFNVLDQMVRGWGLGELMTGVAYIGVLLFSNYLLSLPFRIYATFGIEGRYGFNRTTPRLFILDTLKGIALAIVLGGAVLAGILALLSGAGPNAWLYCWIGIAVVMLLANIVGPAWIMPLFNRFKPLDEGELKNRVLDYAQSVGVTTTSIYVVDGSKRSNRANAYFAGFGRSRRIALYDTLIEQHGVPELVAVVAHEVGHYKHRHIVTSTVVRVLYFGVFFLLLSLFIGEPAIFAAFGMEQMSIHAGLVFFMLLVSPVETLLSILTNALSRHHEYQADAYAASTTGEPETMVTALKTMAVDNLVNLTPHPLLVALTFDHPPIMERISALRSAARPSPVRGGVE